MNVLTITYIDRSVLMRKGKRKLVAWPESLADTTAWERPKETKAKLIRRTLMTVVKLRQTY